ncbi:hypothetical protein X797_010384 [Metarhizium robertsii]|uniref:Uncharacterized protein n=1 Tax=Metarhizium robertsii TaxID=568076 RepID=A0A0A1UPD6_9HYPO|nr:hypothetical protein X797_010384 [Metarhizium robertsii]
MPAADSASGLVLWPPLPRFYFPQASGFTTTPYRLDNQPVAAKELTSRSNISTLSKSEIPPDTRIAHAIPVHQAGYKTLTIESGYTVVGYGPPYKWPKANQKSSQYYPAHSERATRPKTPGRIVPPSILHPLQSYKERHYAIRQWNIRVSTMSHGPIVPGPNRFWY